MDWLWLMKWSLGLFLLGALILYAWFYFKDQCQQSVVQSLLTPVDNISTTPIRRSGRDRVHIPPTIPEFSVSQ